MVCSLIPYTFYTLLTMALILAGVGIQYVIPALLVYCAREKIARELGGEPNHHK
jgi:hypothetical protein